MVQKAQGTDISTLLDAIHATASNAYQDTVPLTTASEIQDVGKAIMNAPQAIRNEFMENLINKIGLTLVDYPVVNNKLEFLKKGKLEYGQVIEDLYVGLAQAEPYITGMSNGEYADPFSIRKLPHYSAFYHVILSRQYHVTRHLTDLKKAFHGSSSMESFISGMMNAITSKQNYDDYRMTVALLARQIEEASKGDSEHQGRVKLLTLYNATLEEGETPLTAENAFQSKGFLQFYANQLKKWASRLTYLRTDLNIAGVEQLTDKSQQRLMMPADILADFDTQLLAWAHTAGKLDIGGVDEIDAWYTIGAQSGETVTPDDITAKAKIADTINCVGLIYDPGMAKIYNKESISGSQANNKSNYWNMFQTEEDIFGASPFKNFVYFTLD